MARATTKSELIEMAKEQYTKLTRLIDQMSAEEKEVTFNFSDEFRQKHQEAHWVRDKNLRDVLVHLSEWHQLLLNWASANQNGELTPFLPAPYNWKTYGQMNIALWEKHQHTSYCDSVNMLVQSHDQVIKLIETFSNEELFTKKHFSWTGTSTLGSYCVSATTSHYDWAIKKINMHLKETSTNNKKNQGIKMSFHHDY